MVFSRGADYVDPDRPVDHEGCDSRSIKNKLTKMYIFINKKCLKQIIILIVKYLTCWKFKIIAVRCRCVINLKGARPCWLQKSLHITKSTWTQYNSVHTRKLMHSD